jgi:YD repeat-containing protein
VTKPIQDYTGAAEGAENDVATEYGYDGNSNLTSVQADEPGGGYQKTAYVYGVTTAGGSGVNSNDILSAVQHPDPSTGNPSSSQQDSYTVDALGEVLTAADRNGSTHTYSYDVLSRLTSDAVTTLGAGVDGSVRRIQYAYDTQGNQYLVTSYDAASGGSIVNQVEFVFNGLGQLTGEYQSHSGAVVIGSTPEVQYAYTEMSGGQNNSRLTGITYPSGYALTYNYNAERVLPPVLRQRASTGKAGPDSAAISVHGTPADLAASRAPPYVRPVLARPRRARWGRPVLGRATFSASGP